MSSPDKRLIFIPHAGGSSLGHYKLLENIHEDLESIILDLPGRNKHYAEPWPCLWEELILRLFARIKDDHRPTIILGHSFGSMVALELADQMMLSREKIVLGVSGLNAPTSEYLAKREKFSRLPEIEFVEKLKKLGELPQEIPPFYLNLIKSDFAMMESYSGPPKRNIPALVFYGEEDPLTSPAALSDWARLVDLKGPPIGYSGNHFQFFQNNIKQIIKELMKHI